MKQLSLQWRLTLLTVLLMGIVCISITLLLCSSGVRCMDSIDTFVRTYEGDCAAAAGPADPLLNDLQTDLSAVICRIQAAFRATNWYITAAVMFIGGILAYFISGHALKPLRSFAARIEKIRLDDLSDVPFQEDVLPEFRQIGRSFHDMLHRLNRAFDAQRQFTGNAAHELRTPLALMQAQLELFSAEHPQVLPETAEFLALLQEQTERLAQVTKTLLEMSHLQTVPRNDRIQLGPMIEEIFADLAPLAEQRRVTLVRDGDSHMTGSDPLMYRLLFNLTENAIKYNRLDGTVSIGVTQTDRDILIRVRDTGCGIPDVYQQSIFQPFFRVEKSRSRESGGVGLGLPLVLEIANLHGGCVWVETSSEAGSVIAVKLPVS